MRKPWSISTTVRNPDRILPFLKVLKKIEGEDFDENIQKKFQILLIKNRLYKPNSLTAELSDYYDPTTNEMTLKQAEEIFNHMVSRSKTLKNDIGLRGRTSVAPLTKMGLAIAKKNSGKVRLTDLGNAFLNRSIDIGDVYFRFFIKWQIPNPDSKDFKLKDGYNIKPFIGVLHLINSVNQSEIKLGNKPKGISKQEFSVFGPTLINYKNIGEYTKKIINLREELKGKTKKEQKEIFNHHKTKCASEFLGTDNIKEINKLLSNLQDYSDNAIRYLRLTRFFNVRGNGFYIDLEPRRSIEIDSLLAFDNAKSKSFNNNEDYLAYISDISEPQLPWETKEKYIDIIENIFDEIKMYEIDLEKGNIEIKEFKIMERNELKNYITELREYRKTLQNKLNHKKSQNTEKIESYISDLENIFDFEDRPILLEKLSSLGLHALNDAFKIQPNYPVGDDNEPTFTAPANTPDIECFYDSFNAICEVTMLKSRDQWYNEGQPVMRHLRDFEKKYSEKKSLLYIYCTQNA
jgi:hypothetical protein